ncbi:MAG: DeoR/GlpR family DNA-binding transcription regulator [Eubacteriales bacterium]|nr:DeoR/GlpR family DNA-binding transcription regulator [Eubacteriales bacterium]
MVEQRRKDILQRLSREEYTKVSDLAAIYGVSQVTMRKDIAELVEQGLIIRYHGKVSLATAVPIPFSQRQDANFIKKQQIAKRAAELISTGDSIMLDSGTTTMMIAEQIADGDPINVITNSLSVANCLDKSNHMVTFLGGMLLSKSKCTVGPVTEGEISALECDKVFIGCTGVRDSVGLTTGMVLEAMVKKAMISAGKEVIAVFDDSKFGHAGVNLFAEFKQLHTIITTRSPQHAALFDELRKMGIKIIFADEN